MTGSTSLQALKQRVNDILSDQDDSAIFQGAKTINECLEHLLTLEDGWELGEEVARYLGDCARKPSVRLPLGEAGIISSIVALMKKTPHPTAFDIQALRVLGNLCADRDENRQRVLDSDVIDIVISLFNKKDDTLCMVLCGFCLNSSMDFEPMQKALAQQGAVEALFDILKTDSASATTESMALKALDNLMGQDEGRAVTTSNTTYVDILVALFMRAWKTEQLTDLDMLGTTTDILLQVLMDDDKLQQSVVQSGKLPCLMGFLDDSVTLEEKDAEEIEKLAEIKKTVSKIVIYATSSDELIEELYKDKSFLSQLIQMAKSHSEIIQITGVNIIGNLARTDEQCVDLVTTYHFESMLIDLYKNTENALFQNTILGCLKHISLPKENKTIVGESGVIELVATLLDSSKDMLKRNQFLAIVILKLLCTNNIDSTRRVINSNGQQDNSTILDDLIAFLQRVDDVAAKSETTRVFIQLVKSTWSHPDESDLRQHLLQEPVVSAITELVRTSKFPVLKNDGIIALTVILADQDNSIMKELFAAALPVLVAPPVSLVNEDKENVPTDEEETRTFLEVLVDDITESNLPVEIQCNACILLENAIKISVLVNSRDVYEKLKEQCLPLAYVSNPKLIPFVQKVTQVLAQNKLE